MSGNRHRGTDIDVVHIYNRTLLSHKKDKITPSAATWTDLEIVILSEDRARQTLTSRYHLHMGSKNRVQMSLSTKQKVRYKKQV